MNITKLRKVVDSIVERNEDMQEPKNEQNYYRIEN